MTLTWDGSAGAGSVGNSDSDSPKAEPLPVIITDTREQHPWAFDPRRCRTARRKLDAGDYSVEGLEGVVAVERKSLDDFVKTVIHARARFTVELRKLRAYRAAVVVVEGSIRDVLELRYTGDTHPNAVLGSALAYEIYWKIPVHFCGDRPAAARFAQEWLLAWWRRNRMEKKKTEG